MRYFALAALVLLSACATAVQPKSQKIQFNAVNGDDPKCIVSTPLHKYVVYPPQAVNIERSRYVLVVECTANNGKQRRLLVPPETNPTSVYGGPLRVVDRVTGSAWNYPPYIRIDFDYEPFVDPQNPGGAPPATSIGRGSISAEQLNPLGGVNP